MVRTGWLGVAVLACVSATAAQDVQVPKVLYTAKVIVDEAEVRCKAGNSIQIYPTNRLVRGDTVQVVEVKEGGWLAIKPPPGSFSWINARFVTQTGATQSYVVSAHNESRVPLLVGSNMRTDKPTVVGTTVMRGTMLRAVGPKRLAEDAYYLPVEPPVTEVRYIRAEAVENKGAETVAGAKPPETTNTAPPGPPGFNNPTGNKPPAPPPAAQGEHPLLTQAQQAKQVGRYQDAVRLYRQLGAEVATTNAQLSEWAYKEAQNLTDALAGRPPTHPTLGNRESPAATTSRMTPTPQGGLISSGPGWLRRAGRTLDYSTLYVLENSQGQPILYATAMEGHSLDAYNNQNVEVFGTRQYRNDLRAWHMVAMQVRPIR